MATTTNRVSLSSSTASYTTSKFPTFSDLLQRFHKIVSNLKQDHENEIEFLNNKIKSLDADNEHLRSLQEHHPHSIFDINYVSNDSSTVHQLQSELERANKQIDALQKSLDSQYSECEDIRTKYNLQRLMNEGHFEQKSPNSDAAKVKELEAKLKQIKDQVHQFDQCNYESEEQIRLLKQIMSGDEDDQSKLITQTLTVKQSDLLQQTSYVEGLLNRQHDDILNKIMELLDQNPRPCQSSTITTNKKTKKKRL